MGIFVKQWAIAELIVKDGKNMGPQRVKDLPLMTRAEAEAVVSQAKGRFVVINTLSE